MTFEELKNGMKDLFSSLGAKTSDSNYAVGLFDKTSAEPKGIMDMASLASVLGAPLSSSFYMDDINTHYEKGVKMWHIDNDHLPANFPATLPKYGLLVHFLSFYSSYPFGAQLYFTTIGSIYYRSCSREWATSWSEIQII